LTIIIHETDISWLQQDSNIISRGTGPLGNQATERFEALRTSLISTWPRGGNGYSPHGVAWSVCVCLSAGHVCVPCKNGWTDRDANWRVDEGAKVRWGSGVRSKRDNLSFITACSTRQGCGLGLNVSVLRRSRDASTSRLGLGHLRLVPKTLFLSKLVWIKGTEYCTDLLSLSAQEVYVWSRLHVIALYTGWAKKVIPLVQCNMCTRGITF